ncbi:MAG: response regulator [Acidobacteriota bacterium]|nr:response regulator [Acidobacteriota bacterium]
MVNQHLRQLRLSRGFTLDQLAEISGINRGTIHRIELNQVSPRLDTLELLCRALGTDLPGLFAEQARPQAPALEALSGSRDFRQGVLDWLGHLEALFHHSADGFAVVDAAGMISFESQVSMRLRGDTPQGREAHPWYHTAHAEDRAALVAGMETVLQQPSETLRLEFRTPRPGGDWRWVRATLRNQSEHPAIRGLVLNLQDITDWREAEARRWDAQKLDSQLQVVKVMTAEFSNLVMGFQGQLELIRLRGQDPQGLAAMQKSLDRASRMLHRMRDICGHPLLDRRALDLNRLVREQVEARSQQSGRGQTVLSALDPGLPEMAGDRDLLARLVHHLLDCLVAEGEAKPSALDLSTACLRLSPEEAAVRFEAEAFKAGGSFAVLQVRGPGDVPPLGGEAGTLEGIFSPEQADRMLAFSAALRTIRDHGGLLEQSRSPQEGTRLCAVFPLGLSPSRTPEVRAAKPPTGSVLVVDDEPAILSALCQMLEAMGYPTHAAAGGEEALALHRQHADSIRLVLLDLNMPVMDGGAVYQELKQRDPGLHVVLCTGAAAPLVEPGKSYDGVVGILRKPFRFQDLRNLVQSVLA